MKDRELENWIELGLGSDDDLHSHFEEFGRWYWVDVAAEARRVYNKMVPGGEYDDHSPMDNICTAAVAQGAYGMLAAMAACLGINADALCSVLAEWFENQDAPPPSITAEELLSRVEQCRKAKSLAVSI